MSVISTLRRQGGTQTSFVFSTFVVMWLSLILQPCTIAATMSDESSPHAVISIQVDGTSSGSEQVNEHDVSPFASAAGECCCGTAGIHKVSEASKSGLTPKNLDDRSDTFPGDLATWVHPGSIFVVRRFVNTKPAEALPAGPSINVRNCVYLI